MTDRLEDKHLEFKRAYDDYPSQDNEGYVPDRGGFKAGFFAAWNLLEVQLAAVTAQRDEARDYLTCHNRRCPASHKHSNVWCDHVIQMDIKSLKADRDAARTWAADLRVKLDAALAEVERQRGLKECAQSSAEKFAGEADERMEERNAALAQVARLEGALERIRNGGVPNGVLANAEERMLVMCEIAAEILSQSSGAELAAVRQAQAALGDIGCGDLELGESHPLARIARNALSAIDSVFGECEEEWE